ncbi:CTR1 [Candida theae]|uniref:Copper transport protein n=1 Tax=Candida theae TaxID=1198502 RepID=A0AAD5BI02_9ASCO|nr:CTR1 [Candida theae]KAI5964529.1 CTR1 [Candida theae]
MYKRHGMHDMGSSSMDMGSMASSTMSMAMETMSSAMNSSSSSSGMGDMDHMGGDDSMSHMAGMHMYFTREFKDYPVIFKSLSASTKGEAFGIFILLFFAAFFARFLEFVRNYLEEVVWQNKNYSEFEAGVVNHGANLHASPTAQAGVVTTGRAGACAGATSVDDESMDKNVSNDDVIVQSQESQSLNRNLPIASTIMRDAIRLVLCIVPDLFGYTLMLAAMTFTLTYFFAVVIGSGVGRFVSERLMEKFRIKRTPPRNCC